MANEYSLGMILEEVYRLDFEEFSTPPKHRFSLRNCIRINLLFTKYKNKTKTIITKRVNKRLVTTAIIIVMLATLAVTAVAVMMINGFIQKEYNDNTQLFAENIENSPNTIEYLYYLPELPHKYVFYDGGITDASSTTMYINNETGYTLMLKQTVKREFDDHFNNEGYILEPIEINGLDGMFVDFSTTAQPSTLIIWDNEDYIIELHCDMPKGDAIKLAESIKISEY